jgi:hypothetical protein
MNIPKILEAITKFILEFKLSEHLKDFKFVVLILTAIFMFFLLFATLFSLVPQF